MNSRDSCVRSTLLTSTVFLSSLEVIPSMTTPMTIERIANEANNSTKENPRCLTVFIILVLVSILFYWPADGAPIPRKVTGKANSGPPNSAVVDGSTRAPVVINRLDVLFETFITFQRTSYVVCVPPALEQSTY